MKLLDALVQAAEGNAIHVRSRDGEMAKTVVFVFTEDGDNAFIAEIEIEELVPLLEQWCADRRIEMGRVQ